MNTAFPGPELNIRPGSGGSPKRLPVKNQVRRVTIKNTKPKRITFDQEEYHEETRKKLREAVEAVLRDQKTTLSTEHLYQYVEGLCHDRKSAELWKDCYGLLRQHVESMVEPMRLMVKEKVNDNPALVEIVVGEWEKFINRIKSVRNFYYYLECDYLVENRTGREPIWKSSVALYSKLIFNDHEIGPLFTNSLVDLINCIREGDKGNSNSEGLLKKTSTALKSYKDDYEALKKLLVKSAGNFSQREFVSPENTRLYLQTVDRQTNIEEYLCVEVLEFNENDDDMKSLCEFAILEGMLDKRRSQILFHGISTLVLEDDEESIRLMYKIAENSQSTAVLGTGWGAFILNHVKELISGKKVLQFSEFVPELVNFYKLSKKMLVNGLENKNCYDYRWREAFDLGFKDQSQMVAESLAKYAEQLLSKRTAAEGFLNSQLQVVVSLLKFLTTKDFFIVTLQRDLARRFLQDKVSSSADYEYNIATFVSILKQENGSNFTDKIELMMKDVKNSKKFNDQFRNELEQLSRISFDVRLAHTNHWPKVPFDKIALPQEMQNLTEKFAELYVKQNPKQKLNWSFSMGSCVVRARFPNGTKELVVSQVQAVILSHFNNTDTLTYSQIKNLLTIPNEQELPKSTLQQALMSLSLGKVKVLLKSPMGKAFEDDHQFTINLDFQHDSSRIKIRNLSKNESAAASGAASGDNNNNGGETERREIADTIRTNRQPEIQAAVVRVMKQHKQLQFDNLVQNVIQTVKHRGEPSINDIKKMIEKSHEQNFIIRDENNNELYKWVD